MRHSPLFLLFVGWILLLAGCTQPSPTASPVDDAAASSLRVGISTNSPPMAFRSRGKVTGLEAELAAGLARYAAKELTFVELDWEEQIPALLAGKIDIIMSAMTITAARSYRISFCEPYLVSGQIVLVRRNEVQRYQGGLPSLLPQHVRVGTIAGTTGDLLIETNKAGGSQFQYPTSLKAVKALQENTIDALVYDLPGNLYFASRYAQDLAPVLVPMTSEKIAWSVHPQNRALLQTANRYLETIRKDGSLQKAVEHWIPFYSRLFDRSGSQS